MDNQLPIPPPNQSGVSTEVSASTRPQPDGPLKIKKRRMSAKKWIISIVGVILTLFVAVACASYVWYTQQLESPHPNSTKTVRVMVAEGSSVAAIAGTLEKQGVIKNSFSFQAYYRLHKPEALQAGVYVIEENMDVPTIITKLSSGKNDEFQLTFTPGESLMDIKKTLEKAGYKEDAIDQALKASYKTFSMMGGRPAGNDIEGFVFPDTYNFETNYTAENVLMRPMQYMQRYIDEQKLEEAFKAQGLTLYQGITLASIIQKEVNNKTDMRHVSQVFHSRLKQDIPLGSDPTFVYPAKKQGVAPHPELLSPYNTYKVKGLPPGPIANPGKEALYAAAHPRTDTEDLYFVAGDDGVTYFSKTNQEHEALTRQHCNERCRLDIF